MIEVVGVENVVGGLDQVANNLGPVRMTETFAEVNEALEEYHARTYGRGKRDLPQTLERHPDSDGHLSETGALRDSLSRTGAPGAIRRVGPDFAEFGTTVWYGVFAQKGTKFERRRKVVKFSTPVKRAVRDVVERNVYRGSERLQ